LVIALLGYVLPLLAALWAAPHVPAGVLTLIASFSPVVSVAAAISWRTERVSARRIAAVMCGMASALLVLVPEADLPQAGNLAWLLVVFVVPATYGVESVYVSVAWPRGMDAMQVGTGQSLVALAALLPIHLALGDPMPFDASWPIGQLAIPVVAACVLVEVLLYFVIIGRTGGVLVNFSMYISLFAGIAWGWVIFGERLGLLVWIAIAVLAVGLALTVPRRGKQMTVP
jgi:drug/metabolite transporter (DMT)-like permease